MPSRVPQRDRFAGALEGLSIRQGRIERVEPLALDRQLALRFLKAGERALNVDNLQVKATGHFRDAILRDPELAAAYEGLGKSLLVEGAHEFAEAAMRTAIDLDPERDSARFALGFQAQQRGFYGKAIHEWQILARKTPGYPDLHARLAVALYFHGDMDGARTHLAAADFRRQNVPPQFRTLLQAQVVHP